MSETPGPSAEQCWLNEDCVAGNHHAGDCSFEVDLTDAEERLLAAQFDLSILRARAASPGPWEEASADEIRALLAEDGA